MEKTWNLDYDCPQFLDFKDMHCDENLEEYFVFDHEKSKKVFEENSSISTCATASTSVDATHFPVHKGPFLFNAKSTEVPKPTKNKKRKTRSLAKSKALRSTSRFTVTESCDPYTKIDFKAMLRSNAQESNMTKPQGKVTVTKPFTFTQTRKRKLEEPVEPYIPMAERVLKFQKERGTPDLKPSIHSSVSSNSSYRVTKPISPKLRVLTRHREVNAISQKEKEILEAEEMKKFQFKAQPVNTNIYKVNAKVPQKRKLTVPDFQLPSEKLLVKHDKPIIEERKYKFRARPAPKNILDHVVGVTEKPKVEPTKPKTPPFALKERESKWTIREMKMEKEKEESNKMPKLMTKNSSIQHSLTVHQSFDKKPTAPVPFSFHEKDLARFAQRDERIKKELEEANKIPKFHAHPLPSPSAFGIPEKKPAPTTEPVPFDLMIDHRGKLLAEKWQRQVEEEMKKQKDALKFKAQPNDVIHKSGFRPKKPEKPLTEVLNICLNTQMRAKDREEFDEKFKQRQEEMEHERMLKQVEREEEEKAHMAEMRAQLVHKANPVRHFKPVHVKKGLIDSTIPQTPEFEVDKRLKRFKQN